MAIRSTIIALLAVTTLAAVASAKPIQTLSDDAVHTRMGCATWCWSNTNYGIKQASAKCRYRVRCTRPSKDTPGAVVRGWGCACHFGNKNPTTRPPTTTFTTTKMTTVTVGTEPTLPPNVPGLAPVGTPTPQGPVACGSMVLSGYTTMSTYNVNIAKTAGRDAVVVLDYQFYQIPDRVKVMYEGKELYDSGVTSYDKEVQLPIKGSSSVVDVMIMSPNPLTAWDFSVSCAQA